MDDYYACSLEDTACMIMFCLVVAGGAGGNSKALLKSLVYGLSLSCCSSSEKRCTEETCFIASNQSALVLCG